MNDFLQALGHMGFTFSAWCVSNWTEIGAGMLMVLQGTVLILKLTDRFKKK